VRAILSPYDKTGLAPFAEGLVALGWELYSTGNTFRILSEAGIPVRQVQDLTGFPEILDGRVKTLHPGVHGGLLARRDRPEHMAQLAEHGLVPIDLLVAGLYPFVETVSKGAELDDAVEQIDIGGPAMIRAAAKNFPSVLVIVDPSDYDGMLSALREGAVSPIDRRRLAAKAFQHVAAYDTAVAEHLRGDGDDFPRTLTLGYQKLKDLRYGENPHQRGALYSSRSLADLDGNGVANAELLHGLDMSFVNYVDIDGAWLVVWDFEEPACVIVKHATPCGLAVRDSLVEAHALALAGDPVSAYGGIVAFNRPIDAELATAIREIRNPVSGMRQLYDVMMAPDYTEEGLRILRGKSKTLRLLRAEPPRKGGARVRQVSGGLLVQDDDTFAAGEFGFTTVTKRLPTSEEMADLAFAWKACKHVKSNAIVLAQDRAVTGVGAGQSNRVNSVMLAVRQAGERAHGSVMASDAYFPFADGVETALAAGVTAVVQPGGSVRDEDAIEAANRAGAAMVFSGLRHFRH
jgi:phosphoribosylaminoimidazolecarboxamide formyltransferase / IMP cyclohydrolase